MCNGSFLRSNRKLAIKDQDHKMSVQRYMGNIFKKIIRLVLISIILNNTDFVKPEVLRFACRWSGPRRCHQLGFFKVSHSGGYVYMGLGHSLVLGSVFRTIFCNLSLLFLILARRHGRSMSATLRLRKRYRLTRGAARVPVCLCHLKRNTTALCSLRSEAK